MKVSRTLPALAALVLIGFAVAQTSTSGSTSQSKSGTGSASSSSSSRAQAGGSSSAGGSFGGQFGGQFGGSKAASGTGSGTGSGSGSNANVKVTRPTHVIVYSPNPTGGGGGSEAIWADQAVYWRKLDERGKLLYAGPWTQGKGALMVLVCEDDAEAQDIADQDPVVKANLYLAQARGWSVTMIGRNVVQPTKNNK